MNEEQFVKEMRSNFDVISSLIYDNKDLLKGCHIPIYNHGGNSHYDMLLMDDLTKFKQFSLNITKTIKL